MSENITISHSASVEEKYIQLIPQIKVLLQNETDVVANMANVCAALKYNMNFLWVGFYLIKTNQLVLAPFQGPVACTRIDKGKGVCGKSWELEKTIIVPDVDKFEGHIACSSLSKSEIVIPIFDKERTLIGVLDVDSENLNTFSSIDETYLKQIINFINF